jgi:sugar/nucleoside kinase (ribokinase family)
MNKNLDLVAVGSVGLDDIETPREKRTGLLGGSASYACAAAAFFSRPGMVGIVGTDFPPEHRRTWENLSIDLAGLQVAEGKTFYWSGVYEQNMDERRSLVTDLNVFEHFRPDLPEAYRAVPNLFLGNIAPALQLHVLHQMRKPRFVMADTMDLWINIARHELLQVVAAVDLLTLNESEARLLTDERHLLDAAERLVSIGPRYVLIKKGAQGSILFERKGGVFLLPAYPTRDVQDPTGAGDMFAGAFLGYLSAQPRVSTAAIRRANLYGSVVASFGVERFSLERLVSITRREVEARAAEFQRMVRF